MKFNSAQEAYFFCNHTFMRASDIVSGRYSIREYVYDAQGNAVDWNYKHPYAGRDWFKVLT